MVENYQCRRISWTLLSRLSNVLLCFLSILFISISCKRGICWHSFCYQLPWFFLLSFWFGWLSMYSGVIFFFTSAPSYDGVMYAINLKCLKSVCCFDVINLGMVPEELVKTKKVVSSINISKWSAGSVHVKLKFCPAQNQVSYGTDFAKDWCNGGFTDPLLGKSSALVWNPYKVNKSGQIMFPLEGQLYYLRIYYFIKKFMKLRKDQSSSKLILKVLKEDISCTLGWKYSWKYIHLNGNWNTWKWTKSLFIKNVINFNEVYV